MKNIHNQMFKFKEKGLGRKVQASNLRRVKKRRIDGKISNVSNKHLNKIVGYFEDVDDCRKTVRYSENSVQN